MATDFPEEKEKALNVAMNQIERQHGKGAIMRLGSDDARVTPPAISTGAINLDHATGIGGIPRGRITEIYGPEASGKTTLALHIIANAQRDGGVAAFIDAEHALDVEYARKLGVDTENLLVSQPDTGEQALEIAEVLVRSGALAVVIVDSVAALVPRAEIEGEMGDSHVGLQARLMSQAMRKLTGAIGRSDTALVFTNQIREKIGVMFGCFQYGSRVTLADGSSEKIGKIVNQELPVEVLSYDPETGEVEPRKVVDWHDNGKADRFLQFEVEGGPSGRRHFAATENHVIYTPEGERRAGELEPGDEVLVAVEDPETEEASAAFGGATGGSGARRAGGTAVAAPARKKVGVAPAKVVRRYEKPKTRSMRRFDLEVEGNHTYLVDGVVVHNSPETTSGGRALKFYASLRLDIRRIASLKDGNEQVGSRTRVKVVKNKCVAAGTKVFDPTTGEVRRIEEIVESDKPCEVVAADDEGRLEARHVLRRFDQGEAEVIGLRLRDGTELWVTPDHEVLTDDGWREAGELGTEDRLARPRRAFGFGEKEPVPPEQARLLGYLIGDGYVGGKTPVTFVSTDEELREDVEEIVASLGCTTALRGRGYELAISHLPGEKNGVLELCRWAGIHGSLAWEKTVPAAFFSANASEEVVGNLIMGIWESDGHLSREQTGGLRLGFTTTSEELAHQLHWLLLRWGIGSSVRSSDPTQKRPSLVDGRRIHHRRPVWEVRVSGIDNVHRFAEAVPTWGPKGRVLEEHLADPSLSKHRGSQRQYLPETCTEPVLDWLRANDVKPRLAASLAGAGDPGEGLRKVLGASRIRRDRLRPLAEAQESDYLEGVLTEEVWYDRIVEVLPPRTERVYDVEVAADHNFVANDVVVSNCAPPFKQAEFDILFNEGISEEGLLIDLGEEHGIVDRAGAWYSYGEDLKLGQGKENAREFLKENLDVAEEIEAEIKREMGLAGEESPGDEEDEEGGEETGEDEGEES